MTETSQIRPAVFLDRDGTIIKDADYLSEVDQLEVFEFAAEALRLLKKKGYLLMVLTNQSGIARGFFDEAVMYTVHDELRSQLDGLIDAIYFCPHGPDDGCDCRKPQVGMIKQAANEFSIDLANSWIIGDKKSDLETGFNAGIATALVLTGYGESELATLERMPELVASDLLEAARQISSRTD
jgi:D-glycero-D-manno-heptose 1,7-bisphosphate phosphatase